MKKEKGKNKRPNEPGYWWYWNSRFNVAGIVMISVDSSISVQKTDRFLKVFDIGISESVRIDNFEKYPYFGHWIGRAHQPWFRIVWMKVLSIIIE